MSWYHHRFITLTLVSLDILYLKTEKQATYERRKNEVRLEGLGLYKKLLAMQSTLLTCYN